jgi:hypothetical protein
MVAAYYPDFYHQVPWGADPNDPQAVDTYAAVTDMVRSIDRMPRGQQYELAQARVQDSMVTFRDPDEYLNPANTASPYYPFVQPYRRLISQAVWPKAPGTDSNLLNLNNWRVPVDGSFESYAVGVTPEFLTAWNTDGGVAPTVTTANPQAGTQSLTYNVPTSAAGPRAGIEFYAPCVPGQQYTTSAYVRQTSASTQIIRISDQVLANDQFNRTTANGYGTASAPLATGGAWSWTGGAAAARSTAPATPYAPGYAQVAMTSVNTNYWDTLAISVRDVRSRVRIRVPEVATGGEMQAGVVCRWVWPGSDLYEAVLIFNTDATVRLRVGKRVATAFTSLATYDLEGVYYQAGDEFYLDFYVTGNVLRAAAWRDGAPAVPVDDTPQISVTDSSITGAGAVGTFSWLHASNTNVSPAFRFYNYSAVGSVEGSSTATTGSYVRLSVTYTATAPRHAVTVLTTQGTAVAGTVNVDSVMHNTGATAGTFASTGSTIYPMAARHLERFPRSYEQVGFVGICRAPAVDALAALAAIDLPSDYDYEVMRLSPDYFWPLGGGENSTLYPDATGNNNPPLSLNISKYGVGELPRGGAAMGIPGGAGATGVTFTPPSPPSGNTVAATVLGLGRLSESPDTPFVIPRSLTGVNGVWALTVAVWVRVEDNSVSQSAFYPSRQLSSTAGQAYVPIYMNIDGSFVYSNVGSTGTIHLLSSGTGLSGINPVDGQLHLLVGIVVQDTAGDTIIYRYIDDVLDGVNTATTASLGGPLRGQTDSLSVGATDDGASFLAVVNGSMAKLAVWNRELNPGEIGQLWSAGQGWIGETSLDRIENHFTSGGFYGPRRIGNGDFDEAAAGVGGPITTMQAPSWTGGIDLLADTQNTIAAEQGRLWVAADGYVSVAGRASRFLKLTPDWTLGEDTAAGEIPYRGDIGFDFDPTFVFGNVTATRPGGATAVGGLAPDIAAARRRYFPRTFGLTGDFETDQQAQDCADFTFYSHRAPNMRVEGVTVNPAANPALWHFALSVEIGDRIRVKRRAKAGNGGAGLTMSADYFVENVNPRGLDFERGTYFVDLELSPIGAGPGPTMQPWILEDATLSVLDSTTVLGW